MVEKNYMGRSHIKVLHLMSKHKEEYSSVQPSDFLYFPPYPFLQLYSEASGLVVTVCYHPILSLCHSHSIGLERQGFRCTSLFQQVHTMLVVSSLSFVTSVWTVASWHP